MIRANITEAKANLSKYLVLVEQGEDIMICRGNKPIAQLLPFNSEGEERVLGGCDIVMSDDWDSDKVNNEIETMFEGR